MTVGKAEKTRQHIIEKAAPFFNKKGYADTSLSDITSATGLTKGAIYGNFENKDDLALAVYDYNVSKIMRARESATIGIADPIDKLLAMTRMYRSDYRSVSQGGGCPILNAAVEADDNFPALKAKVRSSIRAWKKIIAQTIEDGISQHLIKPTVEPDRYAGIFLAMIEGGIMLSKILDDQIHLDNALDKLDEIILNELKN